MNFTEGTVVGKLLSLNYASSATVKDARLFDFYGYFEVLASAVSGLVTDQWDYFYDFILVPEFL